MAAIDEAFGRAAASLGRSAFSELRFVLLVDGAPMWCSECTWACTPRASRHALKLVGGTQKGTLRRADRNSLGYEMWIMDRST